MCFCLNFDQLFRMFSSYSKMTFTYRFEGIPFSNDRVNWWVREKVEFGTSCRTSVELNLGLIWVLRHGYILTRWIFTFQRLQRRIFVRQLIWFDDEKVKLKFVAVPGLKSQLYTIPCHDLLRVHQVWSS
jgi:hypothetical protein